MLVMTVLSMLSDSVTAVLNISLHTFSVSLLIFLTCSLITRTSPPIHPNTIGIASTLYPGRLSLTSKASCWYFCLFSLFFSRTSFSLGQAISTIYSFIILYSKSQPSSHVHSLTQLPVPTWLCIRPDLVPSVHSLCIMPPSGSSTGCYVMSCTL